VAKVILGPRDKAVYRWEEEVLHPLDRTRFDESTMRVVARHVWSDLGLLHPPVFTMGPRSQGGYASREEVVVPEGCDHVYLFHEMAHALDTSLEASLGEFDLRPEGEDLNGSSHGPNFLGLEVMLLDRYMPQFNKLWLYGSLMQRGLDVSYAPKVRCI
jgi:hypothetical protein